jgi:hypothetical protein
MTLIIFKMLMESYALALAIKPGKSVRKEF